MHSRASSTAKDYNGYNYHFTWKDGRRLATATRSGVSYSFTYNDEGIRTSKTVGGVKHSYVLDGSRIVSEQWDNKLMLFSYDESGAPIAIHYRLNGSAEDVFYTYYLEKNLQGDIIALYNSSGTKLVGYTYDAWGNCTTTYYNGGGSTGAQFNPFRYRGYYYDTGLELYYLNSRYYDSRTGRFINADDYAVIGATPDALTDKNLYTYCDNNPVMRQDEDGEFWGTIIGTIMGAIGGGISAAIEGNNVWAGIGIGAATGALSGLAVDLSIATGGLAGLAIAAAGGMISSFAGDVCNNLVNNVQIENFNWGQIATNALVSGGLNMLSFGMGLENGVKTGAKTLKQAFQYAGENFNASIFANSAGKKLTQKKYILRNLGKTIFSESLSSVVDEFANQSFSEAFGKIFEY